MGHENYLGFTAKEVLEQVKQKMVSKYHSENVKFQKNNAFNFNQINTLKEEDITFEKIEVMASSMKYVLDITATGESGSLQRTINPKVEMDEFIFLFKLEKDKHQPLNYGEIPLNLLKKVYGPTATDDSGKLMSECERNYCQKYFSRLNMTYKESRINEPICLSSQFLSSITVYKVKIRLKNKKGEYFYREVAILGPWGKDNKPEITIDDMALFISNYSVANKRKELFFDILDKLKIVGVVALVLAIIASCAICNR